MQINLAIMTIKRFKNWIENNSEPHNNSSFVNTFKRQNPESTHPPIETMNSVSSDVSDSETEQIFEDSGLPLRVSKIEDSKNYESLKLNVDTPVRAKKPNNDEIEPEPISSPEMNRKTNENQTTPDITNICKLKIKQCFYSKK